MIPSKYARSLCFTPRTPSGRHPQNRTGQNYLRASDVAPANTDKKRDPSGKDMQGFAGQMASNQFGGSQGAAGGNAPDVWKVPAYDPTCRLKEDHYKLGGDVPQSLTGQIPPGSGAPKLQPPQLERPTFKKVKVRSPGLTDDEYRAVEAANVAANMKRQQTKLQEQTGSDGIQTKTWDQRNIQNSAIQPAPQQGWHGYFGFGYKGQHPGGEEAPERSWSAGLTNDPHAEGAPEFDLESIEGIKKKQGLKKE
jgi:hypothetical protein